MCPLVVAGALLAWTAAGLALGPGHGPRVHLFLRELCLEQGAAADVEALQRLADRAAGPALLIIPREAVCEPSWQGLPALLNAVLGSDSAGLLGSPPPPLCHTVAALAALRATPFVSWSCPQVEQTERSRAQGLASVVPPLAATADAVAAVAKLFHWKSATILTVESGWWPRLAHTVDARLRERQLSVRLHAPVLEAAVAAGPGVAQPPVAGVAAGRAHLLVLALGAARAYDLLAALAAGGQPQNQGQGRLPAPLQAALLLDPAPLAPPPPPPPTLPPAVAAALLVLAPEIISAQPGNLTAATWQRVEAALRLLNGSGPACALRLLSWSRAEGAWRPLLRLPQRRASSPGHGRDPPPEPEPEPLQPGATDWPRLRANLSESERDRERADADAEAAADCDDGVLYCDGDDGLTAEGRGAHAQQLLLRGAHIAALAVCSALLLAVVAAGAAIGRKQLLKKRMSKGPYKILLTPSDFVFPQVTDSLRVDEGIEAMLCCWLQQLREFGGPEVAERPDLLKGSFGSLQHLARPATLAGSTGSLAQARSYLQADTRARYNGDLVQLKELPVQGTFELKSKAMDVLMTLHGLRHENVNPLLGCLVDSSRPALVFEWCSRGSLEDVLVQDEIKLDWSFRLSLLTDLVRGMRYLHTTPVRVHGYLTSRNCVIDARWVLKVTDYGLPAFYEAQNIPPPCKSARDLLWTAPELLRNPALRKQGSQPGDVYSFGIVMQEVVVRGEPFCMLALSPEEILEKVKRPPPLIRPSVSKGAAPPEAINIMRQCWAEQPDMRPDFGAVHDLFKKLNHGRKVNFVDTMFQMLEKYSNNLEELIRERTEQLDMEKKKTEQLLNRMLPSSVADKLKLGMPVDPEDFREVTIYFSDIVGFTTISAYSTPFQVVDLLNDLYTCFDATINAYNVYKVETIGDAYMVVGGLPVRITDHADQVATMALDLLHQSGRFRIRHLPGTPLRLRIGLHTGPCCAGVVGLTMPRYCLFGDTVNTASRMESTGSAWRIHLSQATKEQLDKVGGYQLEYRGETDIKGKGKMHTYWLLSKAGFNKELPVPPPIGLDERLIRASRYRAGGGGGAGSGGSSADRERERSPQSQQSQPLPQQPQPQQQPQQQQPQQHARSEDGGSSGHASPLPAKSVSTCDLKVRASVHSSAGAANSAPLDHPVKSASAEQSSGLAASEVAAALLGVSASSLNCRSAAAAAAAAAAHAHQRRDLSANYNHYRCLSPSEQHLNVPAGRSAGAGSRFLRRQFSLDRGDEPAAHAAHHEQRAASTGRLCKQNSAGAAPDLERIEEIPLGAARHHSRLPAFASISVSAESLN